MPSNAGWGVLANAQINIVGNLTGWRSAMRETQTQLWGLLTLSNRIGGGIAQNLVTPFTAWAGMRAIHRAQQTGQLAYVHAMQNWRAQQPVRPTLQSVMPPGFMGPPSVAQRNQFQQLLQQALQVHQGQMANWRGQMPNRQQILSQHVQGAAVGIGMIDLLASGIIGLGRVLVNAAQYASNFTEELNRMNMTFGESSKAVMAAADEKMNAGIGRSEYMSAVSKYGLAYMQSGLPEKLSTQMTKDMADRMVDVASMVNVKQSRAFDAAQSGLVGMERPLKHLGFIVNQDRMEVYALTHGLMNNKRAMTEADKMMAYHAVIMRETQRAAGDYARTQGDLANQYRQIEGNWSNLMEVLGNTAVIKNIAYVFNELLIGLRKWAEYANGNPFLDMLSFLPNSQNTPDLHEVSRQNRMAADRQYADEIIADAKLAGGKRKFARHSGLAEFSKNLQEGVFNDTGKMLVDLTRTLVGLTQEQIAELAKIVPQLKAYTEQNAPQGAW